MLILRVKLMSTPDLVRTNSTSCLLTHARRLLVPKSRPQDAHMLCQRPKNALWMSRGTRVQCFARKSTMPPSENEKKSGEKASTTSPFTITTNDFFWRGFVIGLGTFATFLDIDSEGLTPRSRLGSITYDFVHTVLNGSPIIFFYMVVDFFIDNTEFRVGLPLRLKALENKIDSESVSLADRIDGLPLKVDLTRDDGAAKVDGVFGRVNYKMSGLVAKVEGLSAKVDGLAAKVDKISDKV